MSAAERKARRQAEREAHRRDRVRRLELVRVKREDVEAENLDPIQEAAWLELLRAHDDPRVSEEELVARWRRWEPALLDFDPKARLVFGWRMFKRMRPLITGRPASFDEFLAMVNARILGAVIP